MPKDILGKKKKNNKKTRGRIKAGTVFELWSKAGGRCEFRGCNKPLWQEDLTCAKVNTSNIAHIIAASKNGPRGDKDLSPKLAGDITNLMLLCKEHHTDIIDKAQVDIYTVDKLRLMKKEHEDRILTVTSIIPEAKSKIVKYCSSIGERAIHISGKELACALLPDRYPDGDIIELSLKSPWEDSEKIFWDVEEKSLRTQFNKKVKPYLQDNTIKHLSIFAFAPQPLLMLLGSLFTDVYGAEVFQLKRTNNKQDWRWEKEFEEPDFIFEKPEKLRKKTPVLNLSLSGLNHNERIEKILGNDCDIWTIKVKEPNTNVIKAKNQLCAFKEIARKALEEIKYNYPQGTPLNVFPLMPVSANVEFGRLILPRADMPMKIYNMNDKSKDFEYALTINDKGRDK